VVDRGQTKDHRIPLPTGREVESERQAPALILFGIQENLAQCPGFLSLDNVQVFWIPRYRIHSQTLVLVKIRLDGLSERLRRPTRIFLS
jgi:hypothetical protein